ncbi:MAG: ribonuclease E/G, partial [Caulobacteraceae bacterium]|nr:ribonuclease E/G [Caulobacteraceae bacterium]
MSERRLYLDTGVGENRAVVTLDGRPERLLIARAGDLAVQALGARAVARIRRVEKAQGLAFLDLGEGPDAILNLDPTGARLVEGQAVEVEIRSQARPGKGASVRLIGPAEGPPRLLAAPPTLEERLRQHGPGAEIRTGKVARSMADNAQDEALQTVFPLPGGGCLAVEPTRALIAVDVDLGARPGAEAKRAARAANLAALGTAARVLRLKGLGGLVVIDLLCRAAGEPHAAGMVNAVLRKLAAAQKPGTRIFESPAAFAERLAHPRWLVERW